MSKRKELPHAIAPHVRDACLCLHLQRAARAVARRFDDALRPLGLTSGQFSLLMALNRPDPPSMGHVAGVLAMDRTTLTANLKPLARRGLVAIAIDADDRRNRRPGITPAGRALLASAFPVWKRTHAAIERGIIDGDADRLRTALRALSGSNGPSPLPQPIVSSWRDKPAHDAVKMQRSHRHNPRRAARG